MEPNRLLLIIKRSRTCIRIVKPYPGPDTKSDDNLLIAEMKTNFRLNQNHTRQTFTEEINSTFVELPTNNEYTATLI